MNPLEGLPEYINSLLGENEMMGNAERWVSVAQNAADPTFPQLPGTMEEMLENMPSRSSGEATPIKHELLYNAAQSIKDNFLGNIIGGGVASYADKLARGQKQGYTDFLMASLDTPGPGTILKGGKLGLEPLLGLGAMVKGFHGSPHKFDKFSMDKIGTGEGAQAYGHGLYFAESEDVAKAYSPRNTEYEENLMEQYNRAVNSEDYDAASVYEAAMFSRKNPSQIKSRFTVDNGYESDSVERMREVIDNELTPIFDAHEQGLYNVELDVNKEDLLDWDAPLSEQPEKVREAVNKIITDNPGNMGVEAIAKHSQLPRPFQYMEGRHIYDRIEGLAGRNTEGAGSQLLNQYGIPGIKYFDQGSRKAGEGTHNIVMFDESKIKIVE
jgi:hypothetical protein